MPRLVKLLQELATHPSTRDLVGRLVLSGEGPPMLPLCDAERARGASAACARDRV